MPDSVGSRFVGLGRWAGRFWAQYKTPLKYALGFGLLALVICLNWDGLVQAFERPIHPVPLLLGLVVCSVAILITFFRWYLLVLAQDLPFTLANALRLGLIGFAFNTLLPGSVGGDIIKAACIAREQERRAVAVATVLLDRVIGLCGLIWLVALLGVGYWASGALEGLAVNEQALAVLQTIVAGAVLLTAGSLAFWFVLGLLSTPRADRLAKWLERVPKVGHSVAELWRAVWLYRLRGRSVALALLLAMIGHLGFVLTFYLASRTLNPPQDIPSIAAHFFLVPVGMTIQAGIPLPGGLGGGELAFGFLYREFGFDPALGVVACLIQRVITWIIAIVGYVVYLRMKPSLDDAFASAPADAVPSETPPQPVSS